MKTRTTVGPLSLPQEASFPESFSLSHTAHRGVYSPPAHARGCGLPPPWRLGRWLTPRVPPTHALGDIRTPLTRLEWSEASQGMARPAAIPGMNLTVEPAAATIASVSVGTARPTVLTGCLDA